MSYMPTNGQMDMSRMNGSEISRINGSEMSRLNGTELSRMNGSVKSDNNLIHDFWHKYSISVFGRDAPLPILDMVSYKWPKKIKEALDMDGFKDPTPIQCQGWPIALSGRDMVGVAQTGSGKTLCYVLPAFAKILKDGPTRGPKCLVLAPTRELAQQIQSVVRRYRFASNVCLYGGASRVPQMRLLNEQNPQIIIATPGRMIDFVESRTVDLKTIDYLVLDEADRMLDMGFEPQLRKIITQIPRERQTLMWSATWPKEVKDLAAQYMRDYIQINVGGTELTANRNIKQLVQICDEFDKKRKLFDLLTEIKADSRDNKTIIFAETKRKVNELTNEMRAAGWPSMCIHGDKPQQERDWVLNEFRSGRSPILVATDVAARGLDVDDIKFVINFDYPNSGEDYVHRIGRTGRRDKKGTAFTFFTSSNLKQANELIDVLREANQTINPELLKMADMSRHMSNTNKRRRYGTAGGWNNQNGGFKRKYNGEHGGGHSGGPPAKRPVRRPTYDSPTKRYDSNSSSNYYSSHKPSGQSYSESNQNLSQNRYNSYAH